MRVVALGAVLACAVPGAAQDIQPSGRTIQVMGSGKVSSMPTIAVIDYWMAGEGPCAITGYLATMQGSIRTPLVAKAGTAAGLASRLGARDARVQNFILSDGGAAKRAAVVEAVAEAKRLAGALAAAAGEKLGPILAIRDQNYNPAEDMTVVAMSAPAPPPAPRAPVEIQVKPGPIETNAQVYVTFALAP